MSTTVKSEQKEKATRFQDRFYFYSLLFPSIFSSVLWMRLNKDVENSGYFSEINSGVSSGALVWCSPFLSSTLSPVERHLALASAILCSASAKPSYRFCGMANIPWGFRPLAEYKMRNAL